jgi:hypothetical protein
MLPLDETRNRSLDPDYNRQPGLRFSRLGLLFNTCVTLLILAPPLYVAAVALLPADAADRWVEKNFSLWSDLQASCVSESIEPEKTGRYEYPYDSESQYSACMATGNALNSARNPKPL